MVGTEAQQGVAHRGTGAARADQHHVVGGRTGQALAEAERETRCVGVVSDCPRSVEDDGVDGAEPGRDVVDLVEVLDDEALARMGDVKGVEAQCAGPVEHLADLCGRDACCVEVDRLVHVVEALRLGLGHVQRRGEGRADAGTDQPDQVGVMRHGLRSVMYELVRT